LSEHTVLASVEVQPVDVGVNATVTGYPVVGGVFALAAWIFTVALWVAGEMYRAPRAAPRLCGILKTSFALSFVADAGRETDCGVSSLIPAHPAVRKQTQIAPIREKEKSGRM
jgi:hypothetical protein